MAMLKVKLDMQETNGTYVGSVSEWRVLPVLRVITMKSVTIKPCCHWHNVDF